MSTKYQQIVINPNDGELEEIEVWNTPEGEEAETEENFVNKKIKDALGEWEHKEVYQKLQDWMKIFCDRFSLCVGMEGTYPFVQIKKIAPKKYGHFAYGYSPRGEFCGTICINSLHLNRPFWEILSALLHELVHAHFWMENIIRDGIVKRVGHNKKFKNFIRNLGITVNKKGIHIEYGHNEYGVNKFSDLLNSKGVDCPEFYVPDNEITEDKEKKVCWKKIAEMAETKAKEAETKAKELEEKISELEVQIEQMKMFDRVDDVIIIENDEMTPLSEYKSLLDLNYESPLGELWFSGLLDKRNENG